MSFIPLFNIYVLEGLLKVRCVFIYFVTIYFAILIGLCYPLQMKFISIIILVVLQYYYYYYYNPTA